MNKIIHTILSPFAGAIAGAICTLFFTIFILDITSQPALTISMVSGAILGVVPDIIKGLTELTSDFRKLRKFTAKKNYKYPQQNKKTGRNFKRRIPEDQLHRR